MVPLKFCCINSRDFHGFSKAILPKSRDMPYRLPPWILRDPVYFGSVVLSSIDLRIVPCILSITGRFIFGQWGQNIVYFDTVCLKTWCTPVHLMLDHHVPHVDSNKCRSNPHFRTNPSVGSEFQCLMKDLRSSWMVLHGFASKVGKTISNHPQITMVAQVACLPSL